MTTKNLIGLILGLLMISVAATSLAQDKVVVIPLDGEGLKPLANVITVAKENGDFEDPVAAMLSIVDADSTNPYLLVIAPGVYELGSQQLLMKEYVHIAGSGQNATFIRGTVSSSGISSPSALVVGAANSSIRDLTINNVNGSAGYSFGVYNSSASPTISNIKIVVSAIGNRAYGVYNVASAPVIKNSSIVLSGVGAVHQYGIRNNSSSSPTISNTGITISGGVGGTQRGIYGSSSSTATVADSVITISDGDDIYGIQSAAGTSASISDSEIRLSGGSGDLYGIYNSSTSAFATVKGSVIFAATNSVVASTGSGAAETYISNSILSSEVDGDPECFFTFLSSDSRAFNSDCTLPLAP
jgi:hypothetical protein